MSSSIKPQRNVVLADLTSIGLGGAVDCFWEIDSSSEVRSALSRIYDVGHRPFVMGGGSNLVVSDDGVAGSILTIGTCVSPNYDDDVVIVEGGHDWDRFVAQSVAAGRSGVELLSGIPGRVGAAPIQNIGAYGQEVSESIEWVEVLWLDTLDVQVFQNEQCGFSYRNSVFKSSYGGRLVVTRVAFRLGWLQSIALSYQDLVRRLGPSCAPGIGRSMVLEIRRNKGMTLEHGHGYSSAGSFFMNPVIPASAMEDISALAGHKVPCWPMPNGRTKLAAAWLIERAGFVKGYRDRGTGISPRHALSLVNYGSGSTNGLLELAVLIQTRVFECLGVWLVMEPVLLGKGLEPFMRLKSETPLKGS